MFDDCEIHSKERPVDVSGIARKPNSNKTVQQNKKSVSYITAASTPQNQKYGLLFVNCHLTGDENVRAYLGRPWRSYAKTVFINCNMDGHIFNEGWHNWDKKDAEKTAYYAEYAITGRGANAKERVKWSKQLSKKEAEQHTIEKYLGDWTPKP